MPRSRSPKILLLPLIIRRQSTPMPGAKHSHAKKLTNTYLFSLKVIWTIMARRERDEHAAPPSLTRLLLFGETTNLVFSKPSATKNTVSLISSNIASTYENTVEMLDRNREVVSGAP
ncbi:uncharacterized protein LOC142986353 [Anticarsia gemmatalis]|uniref:uncharacterized protein LOC142986353 n=1 Tax=Anticarsia gemmatalis TaxID=129554 RepID=UPI003F75AF20